MSADTPTSVRAGHRFPLPISPLELAIVFGIIAGLVALLMPAVQKARNAAMSSAMT